MPLPPSVTRAILKATCDKTALDRKALRLGRSFREVNELLGKRPPKNHRPGSGRSSNLLRRLLWLFPFHHSLTESSQ